MAEEYTSDLTLRSIGEQRGQMVIDGMTFYTYDKPKEMRKEAKSRLLVSGVPSLFGTVLTEEEHDDFMNGAMYSINKGVNEVFAIFSI